MALSEGSSEVTVGVLDGPVFVDHPDLVAEGMSSVNGVGALACREPSSAACRHGTFVVGILKSARGSAAPAICPSCRLVLRRIFAEDSVGEDGPSTEVEEVSSAIIQCVLAGARVINLSAATLAPTMGNDSNLNDALSFAVRRGVLLVAAAGNQGAVGSSALTRHAGVIPVAAFDSRAVLMRQSNVGIEVGKRGLGGPGEGITSLACNGPPITLAGTSFAAPFVTGTIALLWSLFPSANAAEIRYSLRAGAAKWSRSVIPPLLDAWGAYRTLAQLVGSHPTAVDR
ncbi:S8 family peptidase [Geodermatophilus sp. URMC 65]